MIACARREKPMFHTAYPIDKASEHDVKNRVNFAHTVLDCIRETGETENIFAFLLWSSVVGVGSSQPTTFFFAVWCAAAITPSSLPPSFLPPPSLSHFQKKPPLFLAITPQPQSLQKEREEREKRERNTQAWLGGRSYRRICTTLRTREREGFAKSTLFCASKRVG